MRMEATVDDNRPIEIRPLSPWVLLVAMSMWSVSLWLVVKAICWVMDLCGL